MTSQSLACHHVPDGPSNPDRSLRETYRCPADSIDYRYKFRRTQQSIYALHQTKQAIPRPLHHVPVHHRELQSQQQLGTNPPYQLSRWPQCDIGARPSQSKRQPHHLFCRSWNKDLLSTRRHGWPAKHTYQLLHSTKRTSSHIYTYRCGSTTNGGMVVE
jgi:hypothetical protein